jgi:hypothetical protein
VIKAYHQVGSEEWSEDELAAALDEVLAVGRLIPAADRIDRLEMDAECFGDTDRGSTVRQKWPKATLHAMAALEEIAREKVNKFPRTDVTQTLLNCVDVMAGDHELIFLRPGNWYAVPNGLVFDARALLDRGARFRPRDLLGEYVAAIDVVVRQKYPSLRAARREIQAMIDLVKGEMEYKGPEAYKVLEACLKGKGVCKDRPSYDQEIVWKGFLPVDWAVEVWKNGKRL